MRKFVWIIHLTKAVGLKCLFQRIMHRVIRITLLAVVAWLTATVVMAGTIEPFIGIVNRTDCGGFWRYDFNYETVDVDGETPSCCRPPSFYPLMCMTSG